MRMFLFIICVLDVFCLLCFLSHKTKKEQELSDQEQLDYLKSHKEKNFKKKK